LAAVWDLRKQIKLIEFEYKQIAPTFQFSPIGKRLAIGNHRVAPTPPTSGRVVRTRDSEFLLIDMETGEILTQRPGGRPLAFSHDGQHVVHSTQGLGTGPYEFEILEAASGKKVAECTIVSPELPGEVRLSSDLKTLLTFGHALIPPTNKTEAHLRTFDIATGNEKRHEHLHPQGPLGYVTQPAWRKDHPLAVMFARRGSAAIDAPTFMFDCAGDPSTDLELHARHVVHSDDAQQLLLVNQDSARIVQMPGLEPVSELAVPNLAMEKPPKNPADADSRIWYYMNGRFVMDRPLVLLQTWRVVPPQENDFWSDQITAWLSPAYKPRKLPDDRRIYELRLFDTDTGKLLTRFPSVDEWTISPREDQIAIRRGNEIQIWDLPPHRPLPLIIMLAAIHTLLILGACWYFARRRQVTEAAA
jgi:hypothetical protein